MTIAWVIGATGLLGSALWRELTFKGTTLFSPAERFRWRSEPELMQQLAAAVSEFTDRANAVDRWEVYWAAGVGTMSSIESELALETRALAFLLRQIESRPRLLAIPGSIGFASSAGAIYAGSAAYIVAEDTPVAPTTPYAREKLKQENLIRSFACPNNRVTALIARFSTVYGPGQSSEKKQGLLSHVARCIIRNQTAQIYVPYDTIRDYLAADDAATQLVFTLRATTRTPCTLIKIIASERPTTIAEIVSIFRRIARRQPRIITSASRLSDLYSRRVLFKSSILQESAPPLRINLLVGIAQLMAAERATFARASDVVGNVGPEKCGAT